VCSAWLIYQLYTHIHSFSFPSRLRLEADAENLKTTGDIELQKLKVVPQTVFLKSRADTYARSPQSVVAHRRISDVSRMTVPGSPRLGSRRNSIDPGSPAAGAPFEDLRRRLATINGSAPSVSAAPRTPVQRPASLASPSPSALPPATPDVPDFTPPLERPGSPTESVVSTANSSAFRAMHRLQVGTAEASKAAPAVGSSKANATGLFEHATTIRSESSPERSGIASPRSVTDTFRNPGISRPRVLSLAPVSTYGESTSCRNQNCPHVAQMARNRGYPTSWSIYT
jgi:phosphoinositide-3-kinase, regulatory subunit 4